MQTPSQPPEQNDLVFSALKGYGLDFTPAQDDNKVTTAYGVHGVPDSFVIGSDGRVWVHPSLPITDSSQRRTLELQIESPLELKNHDPNDSGAHRSNPSEDPFVPGRQWHNQDEGANHDYR